MLVNIGCGHKAPVLNSVGSGPCGDQADAFASKPAPTFDRVPLWERACSRIAQTTRCNCPPTGPEAIKRSGDHPLDRRTPKKRFPLRSRCHRPAV
ncbi:hypothetical protein E3W21_14360 [Pseudomonas sp. F01002]|nr:hypothetical protein E3W21_14360 [Pseudomonas sp. F01002]